MCEVSGLSAVNGSCSSLCSSQQEADCALSSVEAAVCWRGSGMHGTYLSITAVSKGETGTIVRC
jgi:hypothetical protein